MPLLLILLLSLPHLVLAQDLDPMSGTRVSLATTQSLLSSLPLPSLEAGSKVNVSPQASYLFAHVANTVRSGTEYNGEFSGGSLGMGFTIPKGRLGYFGIILVSQMSGSIDLLQNGAVTFQLKDFSTQGLASALGVSIRFYGDADSRYAMGFLAGPALMNFQTAFVAGTSKYKTDPTIYGSLLGLQFKARYGNLLINPYILYFGELSDSCKSFKVDGQRVPKGCGATGQEIHLKSDFWAFGLVLGYKRLKFNVYSDISNNSSMDNIDEKTYTLSYVF